MDNDGAKNLVNDVIKDMTSGRVDMANPGGDPAPVVKQDDGKPTDPPAPVAKVEPAGKTALPPDSLFGKPPAPVVKDPPPAVDPDLPTEAQIAAMPLVPQKAMRDMRKRLDNMNVELADLRKKAQTPANTEEIAAVKKQAEELQAIVDRVALQESPRFRERFEAPKRALLDQIKGYLKQAEVDESIGEKALGMTLKERLALLSEHSDDLKPLLIPLFAQIDSLDQARASELTKSSEARKLDLQQQQQQVAEFKTRTFNDVLEKAALNGHFIFQEVEGNHDWNKVVTETRTLAKALFDSQDPMDQAAGLLLGAAAPRYLELYRNERKERERLEGELRKHQRALPRVGGGQDSGGSDAPASPQDGRLTALGAADRVLSKILPR